MMINVSNARKLATWHAIALTSDALTVTIMDMLQWIAPTKSHPQAHQQDAGTTTLVGMIDQLLEVIITPGITTATIGIGTGLVDLNLAYINPRYRSNSCSDSCRSHSRSFHQPSCHSSLHHRSSSTYCYCQDTPHCRSSSCRNFSRDDSRSRTHKSNKHHYKTSQRSSSSSQPAPWKPKDKSTNRLQLMTHPQNIIALMNRTVIQRMI